MDFLEMQPPTILVIGDIILDVNIYGSVNRIANEAPVPVLVYKNETRKLGGCGNVLMNLQGIGCSRLFLISMIGNDKHGKEIHDIISSYPDISPTFYTDNEYTTTVKTRGFSNKKIVLRYDIEKRVSLLKKHIDSCKERIEILLKETKLDSIILSDYNNGFLVEELTQYVITEASKYNIPVFVDPKIDYRKYIGCTVFKPNIKEMKDIFGIDYSYEKLEEIHKSIQSKVSSKETIITLSENGISYLTDGGNLIHKRTVSTEVSDVTGAGDIVISIIAYFYKNMQKETLVELATWLGTHSVKHVGTYVIKKMDILEAFRSIRKTKLITSDSLLNFNQPFLITNGCFDIVHEGHLALFNYCRSIATEGGSVVVALNSDESIRRLKASTRPINSLKSRIALLNQIDSIDWIVVFDEDTPSELFKKVHPNVLVKGGDYKEGDLIGREFCREVRIFNYIEGKSTTSIIKQIQELKNE